MKGWPWPVLAVALVALAIATALHGFWGSDLRVAAPMPLPPGAERPRPSPVVKADYRLAVWAVARNARTLASEPTRLFQAEPCHPTRDALALHHPVITPALIALPAWLATRDPVATFNAALLAKLALCALAMALLVADWTRRPAAGLVAGLLYGFHASQIGKPYHLFNTDNAWVLFGLFFARRFFERGRWRDGVALGICCVLQMGASFYAFFAAVLTAIPILAWLVWQHRRRLPPPGRLAVVAAIVLAGALAVFGPYLAIEGEVLEQRRNVFYEPWSSFAPGGKLFPGWLGLALVACAFALGRRRATPGVDGDPRPALLAAALLVALFAAGGAPGIPNPYAALAELVPGLASVRLPRAFAHGVLQVLGVLAGLGAAGLLATLPRRAEPWAAALLVAAAFVATLRPAALGFESGPRFGATRVRPAEARIELHRAIDAAGASGPMLELPVIRSIKAYSFLDAPEQHLLTAYHGRRTSGCYSSFIPRPVRRLARLGRDLPEPGAVDAALDLGFTTVVVHDPRWTELGAEAEARLRAASDTPGSRIHHLLDAGDVSVYTLGEQLADEP